MKTVSDGRFSISQNTKGDIEFMDNQSNTVWVGQFVGGSILIDTTLKSTDEFRRLLDLIDRVAKEN